MKKTCCLLAVAVLLFCAAAPARAGSIMIGTSDPTTSRTLTITSDGPWGGQAVQVTSPFLLTQIDVGMYIGLVPVTLQFTDALGASATPASILASTTVSYSWGYHVVSISAAVTLQPGTYYLLGSTSAYQGQPGGTPFFPLATSTLTSAYGAPAGIFISSGPHDTLFPPGGSFNFWPSDGPLTFSLIGEPIATPDPGSSLLLLGIGLATLRAFGKRAR